jgi:hypothetical protein
MAEGHSPVLTLGRIVTSRLLSIQRGLLVLGLPFPASFGAGFNSPLNAGFRRRL